MKKLWSRVKSIASIAMLKDYIAIYVNGDNIKAHITIENGDTLVPMYMMLHLREIDDNLANYYLDNIDQERLWKVIADVDDEEMRYQLRNTTDDIYGGERQA